MEGHPTLPLSQCHSELTDVASVPLRRRSGRGERLKRKRAAVVVNCRHMEVWDFPYFHVSDAGLDLPVPHSPVTVVASDLGR